MSTFQKYGENKSDYLMKLYKRGKDFYEQDRKKIYDECTAHVNDREPRFDILPAESFAPKFPLISPAVSTRLGAIDELKNESERFYSIEPYYPASEGEKEKIEAVVERRYARLDYILDKTDFSSKSDHWFLNAETYPVAWIKVFLRKDVKSVWEMETKTILGIPIGKKIVSKEKIIYIGPDFETLQPEQVIYDGEARREDYEYCEFVGQRDTRDLGYVLYKWPTDADGGPVDKARLEALLGEDKVKADVQEAKGLPQSQKIKGVEVVELEFRLYDETDGKLKLRKATFIPGGDSKTSENMILLEDDWRWLEGEAACVYSYIPVTADESPASIEGRSPVQKAIPLQQDALDFMRMLMEALARDIHGREYVKKGAVSSPTERTAAAGRRTIVDDVNNIKFDARFNPNVQHFIELIKLFSESLLNVMAADSITPALSMTSESGDETATLTDRRAGLFNSRLGRTFKNYAKGIRQCVWMADEILKHIYAEGFGDVFEENIYGLSSAQTAEMQPDDMFFPVRIKKLSFENLAKRETEKLIMSKFFKDLLPLFSLPRLSPEQIILIEEFWRAYGKSEKTLQELLGRYKKINAKLAQVGIMPGAMGAMGATGAGGEVPAGENGTTEPTIGQANPNLSRLAA